MRRQVASIAEEVQQDLTFPWGRKQALTFVIGTGRVTLLRKLTVCVGCVRRGLQASTIKVYLGRVKSLHEQEGLKPLWSHEDTRLAINGRLNTFFGKRLNRVAITPYVLRQLKVRLANSRFPREFKRAFWLFATWAYYGAFRSSDLLSATTQGYSLGSTLCWKHLEYRSEVIGGQVVAFVIVNVPEPKERKGSDTVARVELLPNGSFFCPITALSKYKSDVKTLAWDQPIFAANNSLLTAARVNSTLRELLSDVIDYSTQQILGHSFRAGVISALARSGASEDLMKSQGWLNIITI